MEIQWTWKKIVGEKYRSVEKYIELRYYRQSKVWNMQEKNRDIRD